jgi:hypothetical protein
VSSDAAGFTEEEGCWPNFFLELGSTLPRMLAGDAHLYQLVHRVEAARLVLDHPGYDGDED